MKKGVLSLWTATCNAMWRRCLASVLMILVAAVSTFSAIGLQNLAQRQQNTLARTIADTSISCVITDAKGISGDHLDMFSSYVDRLTGRVGCSDQDLSSYVRDVKAMGEIPITEPSDSKIRKILSLDSDKDLDPLKGTKINFLEGWEDDILQSSQPVCLLSGDFETHSGEGGAEYITVSYFSHAKTELKVVGRITGGPQQVIYCPFYLSAQNDTLSEVFKVSSCSFTIRDNTRLEESKQAIYNLKFFTEPKLSNNEDGIQMGVLIQDDTFLKTVEELNANLSTLHKILPILMILCTCIGFFSSFMATRGRIKEFAVMRCIGIGKWKIFILVLGELLQLSVLGAAVGVLCDLIAEGGLSARTISAAATMIGVFLLGAAAAALRISGINVMKLMKVEE